jgi:NAD(P)H-hydrate epimerase
MVDLQFKNIFYTQNMNKLPEIVYLTEQVREMDRLAIEEQGVPGIDLMRKAGLAVFDTIRKYYPNEDVTVFCGAGNNAGDGYVVAKLALEVGFKVTVCYLTIPDSLRGDAYTAYQDFIEAGGVATGFSLVTVINKGIIIDALLGTGLNRDVSGIYAQAITLINESANPVVAVDIPSGLNADTGDIMGYAVKADYTVSFIGLKQGMFTGFAAECCGNIVFDSLSISMDAFKEIEYSARIIPKPCLPIRQQCTHKGNYGHVLVVGGDNGFSGAIRLAAEAALRVGAGLVSVATRQSHASLINVGRPELMCHGVEDVAELNPLLEKASVVAIGPGLGQEQWGEKMFSQVIESGKPLVMDADALNLLANKDFSFDNWVLTPHPGEAARLLGCSTSEIAQDRFTAVSKIQNQYGGVVALKGAGTLVRTGEETTISTTGNPGMASGGMGDTLTGMIAGLIAQGMTLESATTSAVYLHGKAADLSVQHHGEAGLLASDLMPIIRKMVNE